MNMSVWKDIDSLHYFVYRSAHVEIMRRRKEWFELMRDAYQSSRWVPQGHKPSVQGARQRLEQLRLIGPSPEASTFKKTFPLPDTERS